MSWVRVHDGALTHPKIVGIFDPRRPFDLWLWGLSYTQQYLTDGRLPADAFPRGSEKARTKLVLRHLWDAQDDGSFQIHDYSDWNDARETVLEKRAQAKARMDRFRKRVTNAEQPANERVTERVTNALVTGSNTTTTVSTKKKKSRPTFQGQKFDLFAWQDERLERIFAGAAQWARDYDAQIARAGQIVPVGDKFFSWLEQQAAAEAQRRGGVVAGTRVPWSLDVCRSRGHGGEHGSQSPCDLRWQLDEAKKTQVSA